jgi:hypothetical protein
LNLTAALTLTGRPLPAFVTVRRDSNDAIGAIENARKTIVVRIPVTTLSILPTVPYRSDWTKKPVTCLMRSRPAFDLAKV